MTFAAIGLLYWWHVLSPVRNRRRLGGFGPVAYMFTGKIGLGLLGVLLTFSPTVLYYVLRAPAALLGADAAGGPVDRRAR